MLAISNNVFQPINLRRLKMAKEILNPVTRSRRKKFISEKHLPTRFYLRGTISQPFKFSHEAVDGKRFCESFIDVNDEYGTIKVRVMAEEKDIMGFEEGDRVKITGSFRSSNTVDKERQCTHLKIYLFVIKIVRDDSDFEDFTEVYIRGVICRIDKVREIKYTSEREYPYNKKIDFEIKGHNGPRAFIAPVRAYDDLAEQIAGMSLGARICIRGVWVTREYLSSNDTMETTYEVVIKEILVG